MAVIYACPTDKRLLCSWEGYASDIKQHFEKEHNGLLFHTNSVEIDLNILQENRLLYLQEEIYLIQSHIENNKLFLRLRYLGTASTASKKVYDLTIAVNNISYKYEGDISDKVVLPNSEGWEVNLEMLGKNQEKFDNFICTILIKSNCDNTTIIEEERITSTAKLNINNSFVENNVCDEIEEKYLEALSLLDGRINELKQNKRVSDDIMDKISQLNLSILEEPFHDLERHGSIDDSRVESRVEISEPLPEISEEMNLLCRSCQADMLPPIYLCINGHNVCSFCRDSICKECNGIITQIRNVDLENISRTHKHPCKYSADGCNEKLFYNELRAHEAKCPFLRYKCQTECSFEGKFQHFVQHLKIVHGSIRISHSLSNDFPKNVEFYIVSKSKGIFYCKSEQKNDYITWKVVFYGPKERHFFCELYFKGAKTRDAHFLKRTESVYEIKKSLAELKKMKLKEKYAVLTITSYDN